MTDTLNYLQTHFAEVDKKRDPEERARKKRERAEALRVERLALRFPKLIDEIKLVRNSLMLAKHKLTNPRLPEDQQTLWLELRKNDAVRLEEYFDELHEIELAVPALAERCKAVYDDDAHDPIRANDIVQLVRPITNSSLFGDNVDFYIDGTDANRVIIPAGATGVVGHIFYSSDPEASGARVVFDQSYEGWANWYVPEFCLVRVKIES